MKIRTLKKTLLMFMLPFCLLSSGCIYLIVGGIGAVGGYVVSPDTVEGLTDNEYINVWDAANEVLSIMGTIGDGNEDAGVLNATVSGAEVTVSIISLNATTVKVTVKSRKFYMPRISTAQDIYIKIINYLEG